MKMNNVILCTVHAFVLTCSSNNNEKNPGEYWLQFTQSQRVNYLVGYVQGVDTGVDVADVYDGIMYENFFNSSSKFKKSILDMRRSCMKMRIIGL